MAVPMSYHIPLWKRTQIHELRAAGKSVREIAETLRVDKVTVNRHLMLMRKPVDTPNVTTELVCDMCHGPLPKTSDAHRKTRRQKHKFCGKECYGAYRTALKMEDRCKRCNVRRGDVSWPLFTRGYCAYCYSVLREFGFDHEASEIFHTNQKLKKETRECQQTSQSSLRTPPISAQC